MSFYFRLILGLVWLVSWVFGLPEAGGPDPPASQSIHCGLKWFEDHPVKGSATCLNFGGNLYHCDMKHCSYLNVISHKRFVPGQGPDGPKLSFHNCRSSTKDWKKTEGQMVNDVYVTAFEANYNKDGLRVRGSITFPNYGPSNTYICGMIPSSNIIHPSCDPNHCRYIQHVSP